MDFTLALAGVIKGNTKPRDKLRLRGPDDPTTQPANFPAVDLIICCCKEPVDVVLYWPTDKLNILVSDDGKDPQLKEAIEELSLKYANIKYFARQVPAGKHHGYKAGNMNQALKEVFGGDNASPYFCILDADMIPDQEMLSALVAHAVRDKEVGIVALPQVSHRSVH
jgi:cellulose synthase/poly-beta-1,6-N-acetylglucosamine synthase-like glycosyltransferase